jgi:hypothetical protein
LVFQEVYFLQVFLTKTVWCYHLCCEYYLSHSFILTLITIMTFGEVHKL